jgi:hypothetical protein
MTSIFPYTLIACTEITLRYELSRWKCSMLVGDSPRFEPGSVQTQNTGLYVQEVETKHWC